MVAIMWVVNKPLDREVCKFRTLFLSKCSCEVLSSEGCPSPINEVFLNARGGGVYSKSGSLDMEPP
jgi:hypothetical protein